MSDKIWILLSLSTEHQNLVKALERVFWDEPSVEDLRLYFGLYYDNTYLDVYFEDILKGNKVRLYGANYWVQPFERIKNNKNEKSSSTGLTSTHGYVVG